MKQPLLQLENDTAHKGNVVGLICALIATGFHTHTQTPVHIFAETLISPFHHPLSVFFSTGMLDWEGAAETQR